MRKFLYYLGAAILVAVAVVVVNAVREPVIRALTSPSLTVDVKADRHPINPDIYGMNNYNIDAALAKELRIPVNRWGGNHTTRYNWLVDSSNAGVDWFFMAGNGNTKPVAGAEADKFVSTNRANGSKSILTIPMIGYVNKTSVWNCSFRVSKYGPQQKTNPYIKPEGDLCGNGKRPDGTVITNNNPLDNSIVSDPAFMKGWIQHLINVHGTAAKGGVQIYQMDNEPSGWG